MVAEVSGLIQNSVYQTCTSIGEIPLHKNIKEILRNIEERLCNIELIFGFGIITRHYCALLLWSESEKPLPLSSPHGKCWCTQLRHASTYKNHLMFFMHRHGCILGNDDDKYVAELR